MDLSFHFSAVKCPRLSLLGHILNQFFILMKRSNYFLKWPDHLYFHQQCVIQFFALLPALGIITFFSHSDRYVILSHHDFNSFFSLRYNSHTVRLTLLKCTVKCTLFTDMCSHHHLFPKHFHPSKKKPRTHYHSLPILPSSQPLAATHLLSLVICQCGTFYVNEIL